MNFYLVDDQLGRLKHSPSALVFDECLQACPCSLASACWLWLKVVLLLVAARVAGRTDPHRCLFRVGISTDWCLRTGASWVAQAVFQTGTGSMTRFSMRENGSGPWQEHRRHGFYALYGYFGSGHFWHLHVSSVDGSRKKDDRRSQIVLKST